MYIRNDIRFENYVMINCDDKRAYGQQVDILLEDNRKVTLMHVYVNPSMKKSARVDFWNTVTAQLNPLEHLIIIGDLNENAKIFGECNKKHNSSLDNTIANLNLSVSDSDSEVSLLS